MNFDLFSGVQAPPQRAFKDIRNTRPTVAEEKAQLCLRLGRLINVVPESVKAGSIEATHKWLESRKGAAKTVKNARASINDLSVAIKQMESFK